MTLYAPWVRQDLIGHATAGRKLPWFLLEGFDASRGDPTVVQYATHLNRSGEPWPAWLTEAHRKIVEET